MTQKQLKQKKCRITEDQLYNRFNEADIDGNGYLSADQITILLQNLGYEDTYKGTIRKICRYLNKQKKLKQEINNPQSNQNITQSTNKIEQKSQNQSNADPEHKETQQQRRIRKQEQKKKQQEEAAISFQEFKRYFEILQKPVGKILYKLSLQRSVQVATICKQVNMKNMFHKDKGQKLKVNLLVGEQKPSYNSFIDLRIEKQAKSKKNEDIYFVELQLASNSEDNANKIVKYLKSLIDMVISIIVSENQQLGEIKEILTIEQKVQGNLAKLRISTNDEDVQKFINELSNTFDQILDTELTFVIKLLYQFNFLFSQLKLNPKAMIEDLIVKDANLKIQYKGSQFLDAVKQLALSKNVFELLRVDQDPVMLAFLGFLSMEKGNVFFKFGNIDRKQQSKQLTRQLLQMCAGLRQFQSEQFSLKDLSQLVDGPIKVKIQLETLKVDININVKDILKLPFLMEGQGVQGYDSD